MFWKTVPDDWSSSAEASSFTVLSTARSPCSMEWRPAQPERLCFCACVCLCVYVDRRCCESGTASSPRAASFSLESVSTSSCNIPTPCFTAAALPRYSTSSAAFQLVRTLHDAMRSCRYCSLISLPQSVKKIIRHLKNLDKNSMSYFRM